MKLGSLFDGIGGFPLAGEYVGITPVWASEIELFPIKVTQRHFPQMKHLGDIKGINGANIPPVDIVTFGSPCQDLSIAGKRKGLSGERSNLFHDAVRIIKEMREATNGEYPRYAVWENVPGALSSNAGQDFRPVLQEITEAEIPMPKSGKWANAGMVRGDGYSIAWRILDAQYFGIPQRRRRIFLICDFGGQSAPEILFERKSMSRDTSEGRKEGKATPAYVGDSIKTKGYRMTAFGDYSDDDCVSALKAGEYKDATDLVVEELPILNDQGGSQMSVSYGVVATLRAQEHGHQPIILTNNTLAFQPGNLSRKAGAAPPDKVFPTLGAATLGDQFPHVAYAVDCRSLYEIKELSGTLQCKQTGGYSLNHQNPVRLGYAARRLTPLECERLMGFHDGWTEGGSDSARYRALGNSVAVPCVKWIVEQLKRIDGRKN